MGLSSDIRRAPGGERSDSCDPSSPMTCPVTPSASLLRRNVARGATCSGGMSVPLSPRALPSSTIAVRAIGEVAFTRIPELARSIAHEYVSDAVAPWSPRRYRGGAYPIAPPWCRSRWIRPTCGHVTDGMLAAIHGAQQVHLHLAIDPRWILLARIGKVEAACIVHEAMEPTECIEGGLDGRTR